MLCSYCKTSCVANEVSCPNCGAPLPAPKSPVGNIWGRTNVIGSTDASSNRFDTSRKPPPNFQKRNSDTASRSQQSNFADAGHSDSSEYGAPQPLFEGYNSPSIQAQSIAPAETQNIDQRQALLPIPYQEMPPAVGQATMALQLIPDQAI